MDIEHETQAMKQSEPCIIIIGRIGSRSTQFFICAEKGIVVESKTLRDVLLDLICFFYVADIAYPKNILGMLLFFQQTVFNVKDEQRPPPCLVKLLQNLSIEA